MVHLKIVNELLGTNKQDNSYRCWSTRWFSFRKAVVRCALYSNEATL